MYAVCWHSKYTHWVMRLCPVDSRDSVSAQESVTISFS